MLYIEVAFETYTFGLCLPGEQSPSAQTWEFNSGTRMFFFFSSCFCFVFVVVQGGFFFSIYNHSSYRIFDEHQIDETNQKLTLYSLVGECGKGNINVYPFFFFLERSLSHIRLCWCDSWINNNKIPPSHGESGANKAWRTLQGAEEQMGYMYCWQLNRRTPVCM